MKHSTWRKQHKWFGLGLSFFMLMCCLSGILLNHREAIAHLEIGRKWLPESYQFKKWNGGLLRGALRYRTTDSDLTGSVFLYGTNGIWLTDSTATHFSPFNNGFPGGCDFRNIKGMAQTSDGQLWAAGQFGLYHYNKKEGCWILQPLPLDKEEKIADLTLGGDTLVVTGRSRLYYALPPYRQFSEIEIPAPSSYERQVSLFKTVWNLHNGDIAGAAGRFCIDGVALIFILLTATGIICWALPQCIRHCTAKKKSKEIWNRYLKLNFNCHNKVGRYTFGILLFVTVTGWCLRPPVLIALVSLRTSPLPYSSMDSKNAWKDKLRMLRYDEEYHDWLLSTSEGIYSLNQLTGTPHRLDKTPPVSVMGLNVWEKDQKGNWLMGSFNGMYVWQRKTARTTDYFTGDLVEEVSGPPFGKYAVAGYCKELQNGPFIVEYYQGTDKIRMPEEYAQLPISLWNLALEVHTGRIYTFLGPANLIYIFFAGLATLWCLYTGYLIRKKKKLPRPQ